MLVEQVKENKKQYLDLLLIADEQEDMIDKYLEHGDMFVIYDEDLVGECVVVKNDEGIYELKNIAVYEKYRRKGYAKKLISYIIDYYKGTCKTMYVGTGDSPSVLKFYKNCGFEESHRVENFFVDNYDHVMFEDGVQLVDMVYLKQNI